MTGRRSLGVAVLIAVLALATACVALPPAVSYQYGYEGKVFLTYELRDAADAVIVQGSGEVTRVYRNTWNTTYAHSNGLNWIAHDHVEHVMASDGFAGPLGQYDWRYYHKTSSWCPECTKLLQTNLWLYVPTAPGEPSIEISFYEPDTHLIIHEPVVEPMAACADGDAQVYRASGPLQHDPTKTGSVTIANC